MTVCMDNVGREIGGVGTTNTVFKMEWSVRKREYDIE